MSPSALLAVCVALAVLVGLWATASIVFLGPLTLGVGAVYGLVRLVRVVTRPEGFDRRTS
jgi:hypothetical protein